MCLTGVDYFSTLGYQPSLAFQYTGLLAPLATVVLVVVTLLGAVPVYAYVAGRSPHGQGSIAMLERLVHGWTGKSLVLILLGFAATDFVITKTLSTADAAEHIIGNPIWPFPPPNPAGGLQTVSHLQPLLITMLLLVILGAVFMRGFREVIGLAVVIVGVYLVLNAVVIGSGLYHLAVHRENLQEWYDNVMQGDWHLGDEFRPPVAGRGWWPIVAVCLVLFPKLALGLSGFETGVAVMPLVQGDPDDKHARPKGRIRNTRKLLITAALIMSVYLLGSAVVTTTLIAPEELETKKNFDPETGQVEQVKGRAVSRALAYLAHGEGKTGPVNPLFGQVFGTIYDISTIVILWFAGASAMAGLLNLVPKYLPRYGMAPEWARAVRPLVGLFTLINLVVTKIFNADVEAQGGAYATGVLVLMSSACVASVIHRWRAGRDRWLIFRIPWAFGLITLVFLYTTAQNIREKPEGIKIASCFILAIVVTSMTSRMLRSTELRFTGFEFRDAHSKFLWESIKYLEFPVLVPHRPDQDPGALAKKEGAIRQAHRITPDVPIVFVEAHLGDPSEFYQSPLVEVKQEEGRFILRITRCVSTAHVIAAVALECSKVGKPPEIHFGWSDESPMATSVGFVLFGEGNVPWMVRELIRKAEPNPERRPRIIVG